MAERKRVFPTWHVRFSPFVCQFCGKHRREKSALACKQEFLDPRRYNDDFPAGWNVCGAPECRESFNEAKEQFFEQSLTSDWGSDWDSLLVNAVYPVWFDGIVMDSDERAVVIPRSGGGTSAGYVAGYPLRTAGRWTFPVAWYEKGLIHRKCVFVEQLWALNEQLFRQHLRTRSPHEEEKFYSLILGRREEEPQGGDVNEGDVEFSV